MCPSDDRRFSARLRVRVDVLDAAWRKRNWPTNDWVSRTPAMIVSTPAVGISVGQLLISSSVVAMPCVRLIGMDFVNFLRTKPIPSWSLGQGEGMGARCCCDWRREL